MGKGGRCQHRQHSTQQARPCTAGQGPLPLARPFEPGAPRLPPHLGFSCFKDKDFMIWKEVSAQGLDLQGHPLPCCPWYFLHVLTAQIFMSFSHCLFKAICGWDSLRVGQHPRCTDEETEEQGAK